MNQWNQKPRWKRYLILLTCLAIFAIPMFACEEDSGNAFGGDSTRRVKDRRKWESDGEVKYYVTITYQLMGKAYFEECQVTKSQYNKVSPGDKFTC